MTIHKLTEARINCAKPRADGRPHYLSDGGGLWFVVQATGSKQWAFRYTSPTTGRRREMGMGGWPMVPLAQAREKAAKCGRQVLEGKDPMTVRRQARIAKIRTGKTFCFVAEEYVALKEQEWKHARQGVHFRAMIARYALPKLGERPVDDILVNDVLAVLKPLWQTKSGVARTLRERLEAIFDLAIHKEYRRNANQAAWKRRLEYELPRLSRVRPVKHFRALDYRDIGVFILKVRRCEGVTARALEFLVLTAARVREVTEMEWPEIDEREVWTLPPRVKGRRAGDGKRDHQIPLSRQAIAIVEAMRGVENYNGKFVFPGAAAGTGDRLGGSMTSWGPLSLIKRLGYHEVTVAHGLRNTVNSWALDHGVPTEPRRMILSHVVGDQIEEAYRGTAMIELRRKYNQEWADFVDAQAALAARSEAAAPASPANSNVRLSIDPIGRAVPPGCRIKGGKETLV